MKVAKNNEVHIHYTGKLDDGTVFDSSEGKEPLTFVAGSGMVIKGFDNAVMDMKKGEKKSFKVPSAEAYGDHKKEMVITMPKEKIPNNEKLEEGKHILLGTPDGQQFPAKVDKVAEKEVTLDMNHPLAGKNLNFDIEVVDIKEKATENKEGCGCSKEDEKCECDDDCNCKQ